MTWINLRLDQLKKASWNYKKPGADEQKVYNALKNNMQRNRQLENLVVRELNDGFYEIVNGNHRYDAMVELGFESATCFNLGSIPIEQAKRIAIELNETRFSNDIDKFKEIIEGLTNSFDMQDLLLSTPFSENDFTRILNPVEETESARHAPSLLKNFKLPFSDDQLKNEFKNMAAAIGETERPLGDRLLEFLRGQQNQG